MSVFEDLLCVGVCSRIYCVYVCGRRFPLPRYPLTAPAVTCRDRVPVASVKSAKRRRATSWKILERRCGSVVEGGVGCVVVSLSL